jgi:exosome complex component RRP42
MKLSPAELSYLKASLSEKEPIRPDGRSVSQFRPLEASIDFLPLANGSSRIRTSDGSECIVGVKAKVVQTEKEANLVSVDVDITGMRDDSPLLTLLSSIFETNLNKSAKLREALRLTSKYSFKLFIDGLILSHSSHPLNLLSFAIYLALKSSRLPLLTSSVDDSAQEEVPTFNDDWDESILLREKYSSPLFFLAAVVGETILLDPTNVEESVSETGIIATFGVGCVRMISLGGSTRDLSREVISRTLKLINENGKQLVNALDTVVDSKEHDDASISVF